MGNRGLGRCSGEQKSLPSSGSSRRRAVKLDSPHPRGSGLDIGGLKARPRAIKGRPSPGIFDQPAKYAGYRSTPLYLVHQLD
jgi:hypothetical protein